jgi:hypothetical protein
MEWIGIWDKKFHSLDGFSFLSYGWRGPQMSALQPRVGFPLSHTDDWILAFGAGWIDHVYDMGRTFCYMNSLCSNVC